MEVEPLVAWLRERGLTLAVAESVTGGAVAAALAAVPGVSSVFHGGVVAYATSLKRDLVGVDGGLLAVHGPVHPEVASQLAERVRGVLAVDGRPARVGVGTTGVAGPDPQNGVPPGLAYVAVALDGRTVVRELRLTGSRSVIRAAVAEAALRLLQETVEPGPSDGGSWNSDRDDQVN